MEVQNHINRTILPPTWPRGRNVQIEGTLLKCQLDSQRKYSLMKAYSSGPHVAFMNVKSEGELAAFVQTWGPLSIPNNSPELTSWMQTRWYWDFQRDLKATVSLLRAFLESRGEEQALAEFLAVKRDQNLSPGMLSTEHIMLKLVLCDDPLWVDLTRSSDLDASPFEWNAKTGARARHRAIAGFIELAFTSTARMHAHWQKSPSSIEVQWELNNLEKALTWMVFQDAITEYLPRVCSECLRTFRPSTRHEMKFCTNECAHRVAARNWRRRNSLQKKSSTRKEK